MGGGLPGFKGQGGHEIGAAPDGAEPPARRKHLVILPLVAVLHLLLGLLLIFGLKLPILPRDERAMEVTLQQEQHPPERLPPPRLIKPQDVEASAPAFDIELPPQPVLATAAQSPVTAPPAGGAGSGGTGDGNGNGKGDGQAARLKVAPVILPDPNCETLDAYTTRVRTAINRYFEYSEQAKGARIQGDVMVHFLSDPQGHILQSAITASQIERLSIGTRAGGHTESFGISFRRTGDKRWTWQAVMHDDAGPDTPLGSGAVSAESDDGPVHVPDRADDTLMVDLPESLHAAVPRLSVHLGRAADLYLLEKSVRRTLERAQPLPKIPECLKLANYNAMMPFDFILKTAR